MSIPVLEEAETLVDLSSLSSLEISSPVPDALFSTEYCNSLNLADFVKSLGFHCGFSLYSGLDSKFRNPTSVVKYSSVVILCYR